MTEEQKKVSRRQVLLGAGAMTAALGSVSFSASRAYAGGTWDHQTDIVVVGSGCGAGAAAVTAHENGDAVIVLEKAPIFGGTSAKTAGVLWIPNNFTLKARGIEDNREDCLRYLARYSYPEHYTPDSPTLGLDPEAYALLEAFYDNGSPAIDKMREFGALKVAEWRMLALDRPATDYLDHVEENKVPAGRALAPVRKDGKLGLGRELMEQFHRAIEARGIPILMTHRAMRLVQDESGRVIGLEAEAAGKPVTVRARKAVIFATGGFAHNPEAVARYQRNHLYGSCALPMATGDFVDIAGASGARLGNMSGAWRSQVVLEEALRKSTLAGGVFFPPGDSSFMVNGYGLRAVNENRNYNDRTEVHGVYDPSSAEYSNQFMFMIYDQRTAEAFAGVYPLPKTPAGEEYVLQGGSVEELAAKIEARLHRLSARIGSASLDTAFAENLKATMARFNTFARAGADADFQRGKAAYDREWHPYFSPMRSDTDWPVNEHPNVTMHPFRDQGPYYSIIFAAGALDTNGGPVIDAGARVQSTRGEPIPGLYGAGNCIASPSRDAYWGAGCPLGLSFTFGYIAANTAHHEPRGSTA